VSSHLNLATGVGDLFASGIIWAVNKRTGDKVPLSVDEYASYERGTLLDGYLVRIGRVPAESLSAEIRNSNLTTN
jgi:hypothetical protein